MMRWRLLHGVPDEEVQRLLSVARRRRFARQEVVCHRDAPADSMHLIVKGRFAVQITTPLGVTATVGLIGPGDTFGELALVTHEGRRSATVTALEEAETSAVFKGDFDRLRREEQLQGSLRLERGRTIIVDADALARHAGLLPASLDDGR